VNDSRTNWQTNEFIAFNSNLPTATVQQIEGYLAWKWGVQSNLPVSHPYKNDFSSIHAGGGGAYIEGVIPLQVGQGSTFGIYVGQGGKFNVSTASMGAYYDSQGRLYFSTSGGISYDPDYGRFYPNYFSTLGLWLDGKDPYGTGSLPANGTAINTWIDKSVANRNASSIGGNTATFEQGSLQFSTAAYQIDYTNFNSTAYTIFTVQLQIMEQIRQCFQEEALRIQLCFQVFCQTLSPHLQELMDNTMIQLPIALKLMPCRGDSQICSL
jgi:hypothetical protein